MAATVPVRWSKEPEKREWMLEHAGGRPISDVRGDFERAFGHPLTKAQVSLFRAEYGLERRRGNRSAHRSREVPVGAERIVKGYVMVKVAPFASRPQSKDNWKFKHVWVWERTRGLKLPRGWVVLFCNHDARDFDPSNLKAVPRSLIGVMNGGEPWSDRATCEAAIATAMLKRGIANAMNAPRRCGVCGREFTPDIRGSIAQGARQRTCRECLERGLRSPKEYGWRVCDECGLPYHATSAPQRYCSKACQRKAAREKKKATASS